MEITSAFVRAIIGAIVSFALSEFSSNIRERKKLITAIRSELELNIEIAQAILDANERNDFISTDEKSWEWCEIIPMSDSAWVAMLSTGSFSHLKQISIEPLSAAYSIVRRANFAAEKIKAGKYQPRKGKEYNNCVEHALPAMERARDALENGNR